MPIKLTNASRFSTTIMYEYLRCQGNFIFILSSITSRVKQRNSILFSRYIITRLSHLSAHKVESFRGSDSWSCESINQLFYLTNFDESFDANKIDCYALETSAEELLYSNQLTFRYCLTVARPVSASIHSDRKVGKYSS